ncbi:MAG: cupredoxin domain-containing protein [Telluria sp.]
MTTTLTVAALVVATLLAPLPAFAHIGAGVAAPGATVTAAGRAGDSSRVTRTVTIGMADAMRFTPGELVVERDQTVRIVARNDGQVLHEIVLGTRDEIEHHRAAMRSDPGMAHGAPYMAHVAPGAAGQIVWQFDRPGKFEFACLLPGHYESGMTGTIAVL